MYAEVRSRRESFIVRATSVCKLTHPEKRQMHCIIRFRYTRPAPCTVRCASPRRAVTTIVERPTYGCLVTTPECGAHSALTYNPNASRPAVVTGRVSKARDVLVAMQHVLPVVVLDECADVPGAADSAEAMLVIGCSTKLLSLPLCLHWRWWLRA